MLCDGELVGAHQLWERKGTPEWRTDISENHAEYRVDNAYKSASESWEGGGGGGMKSSHTRAT